MAGAAAARESVIIAGRPERVAVARAFAAAVLGRQHPEGETAVLLIRELATNALLHSRSRDGGEFILRLEVHLDCIWVECEDAGGPWLSRPDDGRPHGLDVVRGLLAALAFEYGTDMYSNDTGFGRFPGLRWCNPLA